MNYFLTGAAQGGKSTLLQRYLDAHPCRVGGFRTVPGAYASDGSSDVHIVPAACPGARSAENIVFHRSGLYASRGLTIFPQIYDTWGVRLLLDSDGCDLLLMDSLGSKEWDALLFQNTVLQCLSGPIPVLGAITNRESRFLDRVRNHPNVTLLEVTSDNGADILARLPAPQDWR